LIHCIVLAGLDPAIHVFAHSAAPVAAPWMPGPNPGMTRYFVLLTI
jgi:hypothetical protein